jgi:hypothetical protein
MSNHLPEVANNNLALELEPYPIPQAAKPEIQLRVEIRQLGYRSRCGISSGFLPAIVSWVPIDGFDLGVPKSSERTTGRMLDLEGVGSAG